jgi:hypothetical protein
LGKDTLTQSELDSVAGLGSREAAKILNVGKTTINKYRAIAAQHGGILPTGDSDNHKVVHVGETSSVETKRDGSLAVQTQDEVPQSKEDVDEAMRKRGFDPEAYDFTYRFAEWQANAGGGELITMYAARAAATPKRTEKYAQALDVNELIETVNSWSFTPVIKDKFNSADFVLLFADPQLGKVDTNGGTNETVSQIMNSFEAAVGIVKEDKPRVILFTDLGDGLENFQNTSQQAQTNDLDLTSQVRLLRRVQAEGLRQLAPYCEALIHLSIPSNHGQVRIAPQQPASTESNDWGIEVSHQLEDVFEGSKFENVYFTRPDSPHAVSHSISLPNGTTIGATHGDKAGSQPQIGTWWQRQAFGWKNPLRDADILVYGHFHNQAAEEVSVGRHAICGAASDRGSAWFENKTGRSASSGMTSFLTANKQYGDLRLL